MTRDCFVLWSTSYQSSVSQRKFTKGIRSERRLTVREPVSSDFHLTRWPSIVFQTSFLCTRNESASRKRAKVGEERNRELTRWKSWVDCKSLMLWTCDCWQVECNRERRSLLQSGKRERKKRRFRTKSAQPFCIRITIEAHIATVESRDMTFDDRRVTARSKVDRRFRIVSIECCLNLTKIVDLIPSSEN